MSSLIKIFHSPREVFQGVDEKPTWAFPFFTVIVVLLLITLVLLPTVIQPYTVEQVRSNFQGPEEQLEGVLSFYGGPGFYIASIATVLVTTPAKMLIQAGIFALLILPLGGEPRFRKVLGVTAYSGLITVLGGIVKGAIMLATKSVEIYTNLNLFFPFVKKGTFPFRLFTQVDFFTVWSLIVFGVGLSIVGKIERKKSLILVFVLWLVLIVLLSFTQGFFARFQGRV